MIYTEQTVESRSRLKRFSHARRFQVALQLLQPEKGQRILDYGTGDGFMLKAIRAIARQCEVVGFEPDASTFTQLARSFEDELRDGGVRVAMNVGDLPNRYFDKVVCLEVLEHLRDEDQRLALSAMRQLLKDHGTIVVSVPVEVGLSALAKTVVRLALGQAHRGTTLLSIARSVLGLRVNRGDDAYYYSHVGFNYRELERLIRAEGIRVEKRIFSPLQLLGGFLNSQVFFVLKP